MIGNYLGYIAEYLDVDLIILIGLGILAVLIMGFIVVGGKR